MSEEFFGRRERMRERPILVGIVGFEHHIVDTDAVEQIHADRVLEEARIDLPPVIGRRGLGQTSLALGPLMGLPRIVGTFDEVRDPPDLTFRVQQLQVGKLSELAREQPIDHR